MFIPWKEVFVILILCCVVDLGFAKSLNTTLVTVSVSGSSTTVKPKATTTTSKVTKKEVKTTPIPITTKQAVIKNATVASSSPKSSPPAATTKSSKLHIHKFGSQRNLVSQSQWLSVQTLLDQKTPLRAKRFEITKILTNEAKFNSTQVEKFWSDFFDYHIMKKILMLHNKILHSFHQAPIDNEGIYDVDLPLTEKVKLLNGQLKRYLPKSDYESYLKTQEKLVDLSSEEKESLLL